MGTSGSSLKNDEKSRGVTERAQTARTHANACALRARAQKFFLRLRAKTLRSACARNFFYARADHENLRARNFFTRAQTKIHKEMMCFSLEN